MSRRQALQTLTTLNLSANQLDAAGGEHLSDALEVNQVRGPLIIICSHLTPTSITDTHNNEPACQLDP